MVVMTTNKWDTVNVSMPYIPYADGTEVCNIFYPDTDCQTVSGGVLKAYLLSGEAKIYLPKSNLYFAELVNLV